MVVYGGVVVCMVVRGAWWWCVYGVYGVVYGGALQVCMVVR
jgi:hypothetical protein